MHIKALETEAEYRLALDVRNQVVGYAPLSYEESLELDRVRPQHRELVRWIGTLEGEVVARLVLNEDKDTECRTYNLALQVKPCDCQESNFREGLAFLQDQAYQRYAERLMFEVKSDQESLLTEALAQGFAIKQRNPMTALDVRTWTDPSPELESYSFTTADKLVDSLGEPFYGKYWEVHSSIQQDVPSPTPYIVQPYEEFRSWFNDAYLDHSALHVAICGDELVGMSEFHQNMVDPSQAITYMTGVLREHRRKGVARALKCRAIADAKARGVEKIWTDNEEANPMYELNLKLGFQKQFDWLFMLKQVG